MPQPSIEEVTRAAAIEKFINATNTTESLAVTILKDEEWNVEAALEHYRKWNSSEEDNNSVSPSTSHDKVENACDSVKWQWGCDRAPCTPAYAFILPNLSELPAEFRNFLEKDLIETSTLRRLENSGHLNWWCWNGSGQRLWPLSTTGDGNCLLHAASLGMWGIHDRQLILRSVLHEMLTRGSRRNTLWRRWRWAESKANLQSGLELSDEEWHHEWNNILNLAAATPRTNANLEENAVERSEGSEQIYESLEAIHVFALAHILKRPIVVVSDTVLRNAAGEELSPVPFGGIYLPLECPSSQCHRSPLVLCYDSAHFSALVTMRHTPSSSLLPIIPITDRNRNLLPLHFSVDPGPDFTWWKDAEDAEIAGRIELTEADRLSLICEYMDVIKIEVRRSSFRRNVLTSVGAGDKNEDCNKSMTLATSGAYESKFHSARILSEIAQHFKKRFKLPGKKKNSLKDVNETVSVSDLRCSNRVVAARLHSYAHEYMEHMIKNYLCSARQRFEQSKRTPATVSRQRARLSRSFSTSSLHITCINLHCQQAASQATNFLCSDCFEYQKQLMTSFGCALPGRFRSLRPCGRIVTASKEKDEEEQENTTRCSRSVKSNTMPSLSVGIPAVSSDEQSTHERNLHTLAVHNVQHPSECVTTKVSSIEGANGVTHYYISS